MAEMRMFSKTIVESDAFQDMPLSAQALYFHLGMAADDWGFVNNPKSVRRMCGASEDDLKLLVAKHFLIAFDSGCAAIKAWWINNYVQADRRHPTRYQEELGALSMDENKSYTTRDTGLRPADMFKRVSNLDTKCIQTVSNVDTDCIQPVSKMDTEVRLGKVRLEESSYSSLVDGQPNLKDVRCGGGLGEETPEGSASPAPARRAKPAKHRYGENGKVLLTDDELERLKRRFPADFSKRIDRLDWYVASTGKSYKSHYATILNWARRDAEKTSPKLDQAVIDAIDSVM